MTKTFEYYVEKLLEWKNGRGVVGLVASFQNTVGIRPKKKQKHQNVLLGTDFARRRMIFGWNVLAEG